MIAVVLQIVKEITAKIFYFQLGLNSNRWTEVFLECQE